MILTAPLAALEKVSPALAHNVESAATAVSHRIQDYAAGASKEASVSAAPSSGASGAPVMRPGGEFVRSFQSFSPFFSSSYD